MKKLTDYIDPTLWLLAALMLSTLYLLVENKRLNSDAARANTAAAQKYQQLVNDSLAKERTLRADIDLQANQYRKEKQHDQAKNDATLAALRSGALRVSIPVRTCPATASSADPAATSRDTATRAELTPEAATTLASIAADGDTAIHDLNACIRAYNTVRDTLNVQAR
jgi:prophage endopeptidase